MFVSSQARRVETNSNKYRKYFPYISNLNLSSLAHPAPYAMLSLFARRAAFSPYRLTAVCTPILPLSAPGLRYRGILDTGLHASTAQLLANPRRNASAKASSATNTKKASTRPATTGRKSSVKLTPKRKGSQGGSLQAKELQEQKKVEKAASLKAKLRAQAEKKKEAARKKRLAERLAEKEKKRKEKEKSMRECTTVSCLGGTFA